MRLDPEGAALYYDCARMYSTAWGRFLQTDPIGYAGGANLYAYAANSPLNLTDRSGNYGDCDACWDNYSRSVMAMSTNQKIGLGAVMVGAAALPFAALELGGGGALAIEGGVEATGGEAALSEGLGSNAWKVSLEPQNFTSSFEGAGAPSGNVSATLNGEPLNLSPNPFAGTTQQVGIVETPGLAGSPITDFDTSIPAAPTTVGKTITTIGSGREFMHQMSESAEPNK